MYISSIQCVFVKVLSMKHMNNDTNIPSLHSKYMFMLYFNSIIAVKDRPIPFYFVNSSQLHQIKMEALALVKYYNYFRPTFMR